MFLQVLAIGQSKRVKHMQSQTPRLRILQVIPIQGVMWESKSKHPIHFWRCNSKVQEVKKK